MLTVLCAKTLARLKHRQRALEKTRDHAILSPDLSTKALTSAPEFWDRQHKAFAYVDSQIQRVKHSARFATGLLAFALVADAGIVLASMGTVNAFQRWQQQQASRKLRLVDPVAEQLALRSDSMGEYLSLRDVNGKTTPLGINTLSFDPTVGLQEQLRYGDIPTQKNALRQLSVLRDEPRVVDILADVAVNDIDFSRDVRKLAIEFLNKAPDKRTATLNTLLGDSDPSIRAQAYAALSMAPGQAVVALSPSARSQSQARVAAQAQQVDLVRQHRQSKLAQIDLWRRSQVRHRIPTLVTYLSDGDAAVRESSALALAEMNDPSTRQPLHARLVQESNPHVRLAIVRALSALAAQS